MQRQVVGDYKNNEKMNWCLAFSNALQEGDLETAQQLFQQIFAITSPIIFDEYYSYVIKVFHNAIENEEENVVRLLISLQHPEKFSKEALLINAKYDGLSPLERAAQGKNFTIMNLLLAEANLILLNENGCRALLIATENRNRTLAAALVEKRGVKLNNHYGELALHCAAREGNFAILDLFIKQSELNVNSRLPVSHNRTSLHLAASRGHFWVFEKLLTHKDIDVTITDDNGMNALELFYSKPGSDMSESHRQNFAHARMYIANDRTVVKLFVRRFYEALLTRRVEETVQASPNFFTKLIAKRPLQQFELLVALRFLLDHTGDSGFLTITDAEINKIKSARSDLDGLSRGPTRLFYQLMKDPRSVPIVDIPTARSPQRSATQGLPIPSVVSAIVGKGKPQKRDEEIDIELGIIQPSRRDAASPSVHEGTYLNPKGGRRY